MHSMLVSFVVRTEEVHLSHVTLNVQTSDRIEVG